MKIATFRHSATGALCLGASTGDGPFLGIPALLDAAGAGVVPPDADRTLRDAGEPGWLAPDVQDALRSLLAGAGASDTAALDRTAWRQAPPVTRPGKIIAVGRNYMDHVREGQELWAKRGRKVEVPDFPSAFAKYASSLAAEGDPIPLPAIEDDIDYEIELAVVIGKPALNVPRDTALDHVAGYTICNDVGARRIQRREMEAQVGIVLAKNFPGFAPMGPHLVTADAIPDPQALELRLEVDGEVRQSASTADMIFAVDYLVSYWSRVGLQTGDILITGTPSGVALARPDPAPYYLREGQVVRATIDGIGTLTNPVGRGA